MYWCNDWHTDTPAKCRHQLISCVYLICRQDFTTSIKITSYSYSQLINFFQKEHSTICFPNHCQGKEENERCCWMKCCCLWIKKVYTAAQAQQTAVSTQLHSTEAPVFSELWPSERITQHRSQFFQRAADLLSRTGLYFWASFLWRQLTRFWLYKNAHMQSLNSWNVSAHWPPREESTRKMETLC